jgi:hypothetical protein
MFVSVLDTDLGRTLRAAATRHLWGDPRPGRRRRLWRHGREQRHVRRWLRPRVFVLARGARARMPPRVPPDGSRGACRRAKDKGGQDVWLCPSARCPRCTNAGARCAPHRPSHLRKLAGAVGRPTPPGRAGVRGRLACASRVRKPRAARAARRPCGRQARTLTYVSLTPASAWQGLWDISDEPAIALPL